MRSMRNGWAALLVAATLVCGALPGWAADKVLRIGYQKYGTLVLLRARGGFEDAMKPLGYSVTWTEFPAGPQLLEAVTAGAIDIGETGEAPPIFAQAASAGLVYIGYEPPSPEAEAILVGKNSPIHTVADLKGKKIALNKGSNVHYLLLRALEAAGLTYGDVTPVFLAPADGRAAFESGAVDAWAIWDPYFAAGQAGTGANVLVTGRGLVPNTEFYLSGRSFAQENPAAIKALLAAIDEVGRWAVDHKDEAARDLSATTHIPVPLIVTSLDRHVFGVKPLDDTTTAAQQKVADAFVALHLLPKTIRIEDAVYKPAS